MVAHPEGPLFRNSAGRPWTTDAVNCGFDVIQRRMGKAEMKRLGESISAEATFQHVCTLKPTKTVEGQDVKKSEAELRCEAKRKLTSKRAGELAPRYSLYALRHSWATNALKKGVDPLTVAILMAYPLGREESEKTACGWVRLGGRVRGKVGERDETLAAI
jgi:hypothetical protein